MGEGPEYGGGAGSQLPGTVLWLSGASTVVAVLVSAGSIWMQLKNYRKPLLQRMVIRIMVMVPLYAIASLISLFSMEAAFVIDAIRDIYEAFVIYCFFVLLLSYLGGERSVLILLHGRPPKEPPFPVSIFKRELDVSDPHTFLFLKRGILQYVQLKPILAVAILILKACGKYNEGDFRANSGYLYVSIIYNISICTSLYCLAMFWLCVNDDLKSFRPVPKFLCVKGILFFSFWQSVGISVLVAARLIAKLGPYTDPEHISVGLNDTLICLEMPIFAIAHQYAFSYRDYMDPRFTFIGRMPMYYAFRDAFGIKDVIEDSKATLRGKGMDYREFEPSEGFMHQGIARERRIKAGLRYSQGGKRKYWLPKPAVGQQGPLERGVNRVITEVAGLDQGESVYAPLLNTQADHIVRLSPELGDGVQDPLVWDHDSLDHGYELPFGDIDEDDEELFTHSKRYIFGDYNYPCLDISQEAARISMWKEERRIIRNETGALSFNLPRSKSPDVVSRLDAGVKGYGATSSSSAIQRKVDYEAQGQGEEQDILARDYPNTRTGQIYPSRSGSRSPYLPETVSSVNDASRSFEASGSRSGLGNMQPPAFSSPKGRYSPQSPVVREDAVDLVVGDSRGSGLRGAEGSGLIQVYPQPQQHQPEPRLGQNLRGKKHPEVGVETVLEEGDANVVRVQTPPPHALLDVYTSGRYDISSEHNPWS